MVSTDPLDNFAILSQSIFTYFVQTTYTSLSSINHLVSVMETRWVLL